MNTTHLRRSLAAIATATACLVLMASPAAATPHDADITGGVMTFTKTGYSPENINFSPGTPSCAGPTMALDETGTTITVTALNYSHVVTYVNANGGAGGTYLTVLTRSTVGNSAGVLNSTVTPHTITNMRVGIMITVYNTQTCTPVGAPICRLAYVLNLGGSSTSVSASGTFSLTGNSVGNVIAFPNCAAGPIDLVGTSVTVTNPITGHLTT